MAIPPPSIVLTPALLLAERGKPFAFTYAATGSPTLWEASGLPPGLEIDAETGAITGIPTSGGVYSVILRASNFDVRVFSADSGSDTIACPGHPFQEGDLVSLATTGVLPVPLTANDLYEIRDLSGSSFKLAASTGGPAIDLLNNGTGTHTIRKKQTDEYPVLFAVEETTSIAPQGDISIEVDVDLVTGRVTVLGAESAEWGPPTTEQRQEGRRRAILAVKAGDRIPLAIGYTRNGVLQDLTLSSIVVTAKENEPEGLITLSSGAIEKIGSGTATRYKTDLIVSEDAWRVPLSGNEEDSGTYLDALAEIQMELPSEAESVDLTSTTNLAPDLVSDSSQTDAFAFNDLPQIGSVLPYELAVDLVFPSHPSQNLSLLLQLGIQWTGSAFEVVNTEGETEAVGPDESHLPHWQASFELVDLAGTSTGIAFNTITAASASTGGWAIIIPISAFGLDGAFISSGSPTPLLWWNQGPYGITWQGLGLVGESMASVTVPLDDGANAEQIMYGITSAGGAGGPLKDLVDQITGVILNYEQQSIILTLVPTHTFAGVEVTHYPSANPVFIQPEALDAISQPGLITARLTMDASMGTYRRTSETFILRTERGLKGASEIIE